MNQEQKQNLIKELVPFLNNLQSNEIVTNGKNFKIIAVVKMPILFSDLMLLSDAELEKLEKLMLSAKAAKQVQKNDIKYMKDMPNYDLAHETEKKYIIK